MAKRCKIIELQNSLKFEGENFDQLIMFADDVELSFLFPFLRQG